MTPITGMKVPVHGTDIEYLSLQIIQQAADRRTLQNQQVKMIGTEKNQTIHEIADMISANTGAPCLSWNEVRKFVQEFQLYNLGMEQTNHSLMKNQRQILNEKKRYFNLFRYAPYAFILLNREGLVLDMNQAAAEYLKCNPFHHKNRLFLKLLCPESIEAFFSCLKEIQLGMRCYCDLHFSVKGKKVSTCGGAVCICCTEPDTLLLTFMGDQGNKRPGG